MDKLIAGYPDQLREAIEIGKNSSITPHNKEIHEIVLSGLGGSGIGGNLTQEFVAHELKIPFLINKSYDLPAFVDENTLVIISSYSGNTEETVAAMHIAKERGCKIIGITSAGKIAAFCKEEGLDCIMVPANMPSPRACLGYSFVQQLFILEKLGFIKNTFEAQLLDSAVMLEKEMDAIKGETEKIAKAIADKMPVIYAADHNEAVAVRLRQQINENGKMLCWHHVVPEMNHNELVGWKKDNKNVAVLWLRNENDHPRTQVRMNLNKEIIGKKTPHQFEIWSKGNNNIARAMYLIHYGDWISFYLSEERNVDPIEVDIIDYLKGELAKV